MTTLSTRNKKIDGTETVIETETDTSCATTMTTTTCDGDVQAVVVVDDDDDLESGGRRRQYKPHQESLVIQTPMGCIRGKYQLRAVVQTAALSVLVIGCAVLHIYNSSFPDDNGNDNYDEQEQEQQNYRFLQDATIVPTADPTILCSSLDMASSWWMTVIYIIGILYMFLALAIICDEFFVPALEELSGPRRLNLSMDVAGKYNTIVLVSNKK
ncbi:MAG: hypothetical protein ACI8RD_001138 [Bacillariaceae sp.]|jgi:hypothetical protein